MKLRIKKKVLRNTGIILLVLGLAWTVYAALHRDPYRFDKDSFSYTNRGNPEFTVSLLSHNTTFDLYKVTFKSRPFLDNPSTVHALLVMPAGTDLPGVVLLPGGGVTKEAELIHAIWIAQMGYAVLVIDQRGLGETAGSYPSMDQDYQLWREGKEPIQHLSVYDAIRAADVLRRIDNVDADKIAIAGLSMGGRYAIIAAALDNDIKGVVGISTGGFHVPQDPSNPQQAYLLSIDPDNYIAKISPRPVYMVHGTNDSKIPPGEAQVTFSLAKEPKKFYLADGCGHGFCEAMREPVREALRAIFEG